ncbi:exodeoxyribonuclease VII large subunit [Oryzomonas rubra]|uniref:Exodeoxyribonuclease 7 large subunit n=1 Tax=Oryzomonas rubra TaxID=2509454 RepID=A0A5A9XP78_9BACT|nr:exodeoxyribonuclease VII large subunit [Oryzomonas rubra]KAA0894982.1 exodeoxyribonuclease VII large subunit [Oryzomonas rubra]
MDIFAEKTILTVSRLTALIRGVLEDNFDQVWVEGEVSNLSLPSSGHLYFTLKDSGAQVRCVMFKSAVKNLKFRLSDGMGLIVRGRLSVYDQRGEYQIICEYLEPAGVGALQLAFMQLKELLTREGLFDEVRKRPMPRFPKRVGVVTSPTGAAIHDILNVLKRRFASLEVVLYPVRVQGDGAAREIAAAIADMNRLGDVDVLIVGRGGGSLEDLWAFNEEVVARAVRRSRIPIISAVGHETDWTICDFAADLRAPTPSAAAELVSASAEELRGQVESLAHRLRLGIESYLAARESRLDLLRRALHDPTTLVGHLAQRVDDLTERLALSLENGLIRRREQLNRLNQSLSFSSPIHLIADRRQRLQRLESDGERLIQSKLEVLKLAFGEQAARLEVLSPLSTLARGYAIARRCKDGTVATDAAQLAEGELLKLNFRRGTAICRIESREA